VILTALIMTRIIGGKYIERKYGTWYCGFEALSERMQYSATGFSKPIKIVLKAMFRPTRTIKIEGDLTYHPESIEYTVSAEPIFERYLYGPLVRAVKNFSKKIKFRIQTGSIHTYLIYIFLAVLALMLYNRLS